MIFSLFFVRDEGLTACSHFQYRWFINLSIILSFLFHSHLSLVLCSACLALTFWLIPYHAGLCLSCNLSVPPSIHRGTNVQSISKDRSCKTPPTKSGVQHLFLGFFFWRLGPWAELMQAQWKSSLSQGRSGMLAIHVTPGCWLIAGSVRVKGNAMPGLAARVSCLSAWKRGATPCQPLSHATSTSQGKALCLMHKSW